MMPSIKQVILTVDLPGSPGEALSYTGVLVYRHPSGKEVRIACDPQTVLDLISVASEDFHAPPEEAPEEAPVNDYIPPPLVDVGPDGSVGPSPSYNAEAFAQPVPVGGPPRAAAQRRVVEMDEAGNPVRSTEEPLAAPPLGIDPMNPFGVESL